MDVLNTSVDNSVNELKISNRAFPRWKKQCIDIEPGIDFDLSIKERTNPYKYMDLTEQFNDTY